MHSPIFAQLLSSRPTVRYTLLASEARGHGHTALAAAMDARADSEAGRVMGMRDWFRRRRREEVRPVWRLGPGCENFVPCKGAVVSDRSLASVETGPRVLVQGRTGVSVCVWSEESGWMCTPPQPMRLEDSQWLPTE